VNPYLAAGLAMCAISIIALALTAYLAVIFNRRAKADLERAFTPLAAVVDGEVDLDEATISGRYAGHIAEARMLTSLTNPGRTFQTSIIDGAGGSKWLWSFSRPRKAGDEPETHFESQDASLENAFLPEIDPLLLPIKELSAWTTVEYDPGPGHIRLTRPMRTRRELPSPAQFRADLDALVAVAGLNREVQYKET